MKLNRIRFKMKQTEREAGHLLKRLDMFKMPAELFLHRRNRDNNQRVEFYYLGTRFGGIVTILISILIVAYFIGQTVTILDQSEDILS